MFRLNLLVRNSIYPITRRYYCTPPKSIKERVKEKFYIIDINREPPCPTDLKKRIQENQALRKIERREMRNDQWKRLMAILVEIFDKYKLQAADKLKEMGVNEKVAVYKNELKNVKLKEKLAVVKINSNAVKKVVEISVNQIKEINASDGLSKTLQLSKNLRMKIHEYWNLFNQSPYKPKLIKFTKLVFEYSKFAVVEIFKFLRDVYKAPVKKIH